jgi:hypothetical protein
MKENNECFKFHDFVVSEIFVMPPSIPLPAPDTISFIQMNITMLYEKKS